MGPEEMMREIKRLNNELNKSEARVQELEVVVTELRMQLHTLPAAPIGYGAIFNPSINKQLTQAMSYITKNADGTMTIYFTSNEFAKRFDDILNQASREYSDWCFGFVSNRVSIENPPASFMNFFDSNFRGHPVPQEKKTVDMPFY